MARTMRALGLVLVLVVVACGDAGEFGDETAPDGAGQSVTSAPAETAPPPTTALPPSTLPPATTAPPPSTLPPATTAPPPLTMITQPPASDKEPPKVTLPPPTADVPVPAPGGSVEQARADLASRLGVPVDQVTVVRAGEVTWRDGSLGCPQPGMAYTQALVNGMQILLEVGSQTYAYHSGGTGAPFYCATPQDPLPPEAGGYGDS